MLAQSPGDNTKQQTKLNAIKKGKSSRNRPRNDKNQKYD